MKTLEREDLENEDLEREDLENEDLEREDLEKNPSAKCQHVAFWPAPHNQIQNCHVTFVII